jgi:hypothetical protein
MVDMVELGDELWREYVRRQLAEMRAVNFHEGPFQAGWESAIEEIEERLGVQDEAHD